MGQSPQNRTRKWDLMVVDDDPSVGKLIGLYTSDRCCVTLAKSAYLAMALIEKQAPELVFANLYLSDKDGLWLLEQICAHYPRIPVTIMVGEGHNDLAVKALKGGACDFMLKPFSRDSVNIYVDRAIDKVVALQNDLKLTLEQATHAGMLGTLSSNFSHDILNPISIILGIAGILRKQLDKASLKPEQTYERLQAIQSQSHIVTEICANLSQMARSIRTEECQSTPLKYIFWDVSCMCLTTLTKSRINIQIEEISEQVCVFCHRLQISQAISWILLKIEKDLNNAEEKYISINVHDLGHSKKIVITYPGIHYTSEPSSVAHADFEKALKIIERHRGEVQLKTSVDRLTNFYTINLPIKGD